MVLEVGTDIGEDPISTANCHTSGSATLEDKQTRFTILINRLRVLQQFFRDDALKLEEAVTWIFEAECSTSTGVHLQDELLL